MDSGTVLLRSFDDSFWNLLEDAECPYEMFVLNFQYRLHKGQVLNGFFGARKGNPFVQRWLRVFFEIWKGRTDCIGLRESQLEQLIAPKSFGDRMPRSLSQSAGLTREPV